MAAPPPILYRETRIQPAPASPSSVLHIDTTSSSPRPAPRRAGNKRSFDEVSGLDEEAYARKHLATEGSVFFRAKARSPRSFLWRVVDDRKALEIQAVDLVQSRRSAGVHGWLTFRIELQEPVLRHGVAFADPAEHDALECFVLTEAKELLTVTLRRDLLARGAAPAEFDPSTCVKRYTSSVLSVRQPYRFHAVSSLELLVSLADGGLVRFERQANESGSQWRETFFSEGGWSGTLTLKKFNPFAHQHTVRYGDWELDPTAIADMAKSPDGKYVWTVSLDHSLRAWSTTTGKVAAKIDLLDPGEDLEVPRRQTPPYVMSAEQGTLLQIVTLTPDPHGQAVSKMQEDGKYSIVLHSPKDHQFKFYDISHAYSSVEGETVRITDTEPGTRLVPPVEELMNTNIWHLEQFHIQPASLWWGTRLWIRARSGALCRIFTITFDLVDDEGRASDLQDVWSKGWSVVDPESLTSEDFRLCVDFPGDLDVTANAALTPTEKWLAFLFYPGRFDTASIETALHIYRKGRGLPASSARGIRTAEQPLEERLTKAITSKVPLRRVPDEQPEYDRYQRDIQVQWQTFYSLLSHLHNRGHESIGFGVDTQDGLPWSVCANYIAPIRACSGLEKRSLNTEYLDRSRAESVDDVLYAQIYPKMITDEDDQPWESVYFSRLLAAARELRHSLSSGARAKLAGIAVLDALVPYDDAPAGRAATAYEKAGFEEEVSDEDFEALTVGVESLGGLGALNDDTIMGLLEWLDAEGHGAGRDGRLILCPYGVRFTIEVARESLQRAQRIILDVIALVVFLAGGFEAGELDPDFDADKMYESGLHHLKRVELLLWLVGNTRSHTEGIAASQSTSEPAVEVTREITLLEDIWIGDWQPIEPHKERLQLPELLTIWSKTWIGGIDLQDLSWDGVTAHILAHLLKKRAFDLAVDFVKFTTDETAWLVYLKGRLHVATGNYAQASVEFHSAASGLSSARLTDTAGFLSPEEYTYFAKGYARYFQHIAAIFEKLRVYSYVADFASQALQHTEPVHDFARSIAALDRKKSQHDSPAHDRIASTQEEIRLIRLKETRNEVLYRLFNALKETGRDREAYEALAQIEDPPMKRQGLRNLLDACVKRDAVASLLGLPFEGDLAQEADKVLAEKAQKELASGASTAAASRASTPAYQILYAFRTHRGDFRGAAEIVYEHLERLRRAPALLDPDNDTLPEIYVLLINTLACCGDDDAWLLAEPLPGVHHASGGVAKRKLVTLADLRREYAAELDRRSDWVHGRFAIVGGDGEELEMDIL